MPSAPTMKTVIRNEANDLRAETLSLRPYNGKVTLLIDTWSTPHNRFAILGVLAYFIDKNFETRKTLLGFIDTSSDQGGSALNGHLIALLRRWNLLGHVQAVSADNGGHFDIKAFHQELASASQ